MTTVSNTTKIEAAMKIVILDAIEKGHTNKEELIHYMASKTFKKAVESYVNLLNKQF